MVGLYRQIYFSKLLMVLNWSEYDLQNLFLPGRKHIAIPLQNQVFVLISESQKYVTYVVSGICEI